MIARTMRSLLAGTMLLLMAGCDVGTADPLLYDDAGSLRLEVDASEVEAAGIANHCSDIDLQAFNETVRIPVEGGEEGLELVGVGGLALCLDDEDEGEDEGEDDLPGLDDVGGLDDEQAMNVDFMGEGSEEDDGEASNDTETDVDVNHDGSHTTNNQQLRPPPTVLRDPTPEPVGE